MHHCLACRKSPVWKSIPSLGLRICGVKSVNLLHDRFLSGKLDGTYSVQVVQDAGSVFLIIGSHTRCVLSQKRLNVYTGMQM